MPSASWLQKCAPTISVGMAVCHWMPSAICSPNGGRARIAGFFKARCFPSIPRWRPRSWGALWICGLVLSAASPFPSAAKRCIVRLPAKKPRSASRSGITCGKGGQRVEICRFRNRTTKGFFILKTSRVVIYHCSALFWGRKFPHFIDRRYLYER